MLWGPMRSLFLLLLALLAAAALYLATTREEAPPPPSEETPRELSRGPRPGERLVLLDVEGMCCLDCPKAVQAHLLAAPGVHAAAVDLHTATAQVLCDEKADIAAIRAAATFDEYVARERP